MTACIIGLAHTPFGKLDAETVESLIVRVATEALHDAGVAPKDVDEIVLGHFNAGFSAQDFTASLVLQASPDLRFKRATRVENACATGSAAVHQGLKAIAAKTARIVLVVGVEQMTTTPGPEIGRNLLKASYLREEADIQGGFAGVFGKIAGLYFQKYGDQSDALALIAAKNHKNGVGNPYAQMRKDLGYEFCRTESDKNPFVAGPLKRTDCSLVSDGAAAVVLADVETALRMNKAIIFRAAEHVQDFLPLSKRDILKFEGCAQAWARTCGVNTDELLVSQPDNGEQALEIVDTLVRSGAVDLVVVDSVAALVPKAEIEGEMGDAHVGLQARLMSQALRKLTGTVSKTKTTVMFINQLREKIGVMFGNPITQPGGRALKFYASQRLDVAPIEPIKVGTDVIGRRVKVKVVKNKVAPPFKIAELEILAAEGISREGGLVDMGLLTDVLSKYGAWFNYGETRLGQGRENTKQFLREHEDVAKEIDAKIRERSAQVPVGVAAAASED